jgi:hypothetical protein
MRANSANQKRIVPKLNLKSVQTHEKLQIKVIDNKPIKKVLIIKIIIAIEA